MVDYANREAIEYLLKTGEKFLEGDFRLRMRRTNTLYKRHHSSISPAISTSDSPAN